MILSLNLQNFMVFPKAFFDFSKGLNIITGETGAGKSTILNGLLCAFGGRASTDFIRTDCDQASIIVCLAMDDKSLMQKFCEEHHIPVGDTMIIRRVIGQKRSFAYMNDVPVSVQLLQNFYDLFIEICGQFADRETLSMAGFRMVLDSYLGDGGLLKKTVMSLYDAMKQQETLYLTEQELLKQIAKEQDYLQHVLTELKQLKPQPNEEQELVKTRTSMMAVEKNMVRFEQVMNSLTYEPSLETGLLDVIKTLTSLSGEFPTALNDIIDSFNVALEHISTSSHELQQFVSTLQYDADALAYAEERLFALRGLARKHHVGVDDLYALGQEWQEKLDKIEQSDAHLHKLAKKLSELKADYEKHALLLRAEREKIIPVLTVKMQEHLNDLGLENATFRIRLEEIPPQKEGMDQVIFELSTGAGMAFGAVHKTASGGEMSRFMLALKAVSSEESHKNILIFDEIDRGVGGATAAAVGDKLKHLSKKLSQVIVITHSPQVAACGVKHFHIQKQINERVVQSDVTDLDKKMRQEEIARMLAGSNITPEARAAADKLLEGSI